MKRILQGIAVVLALGAMAQAAVQANEKQTEKPNSKESAPKGEAGKSDSGVKDTKPPVATRGEPGI